MPPDELLQQLNKNKKAASFFEALAFTHRREYVEWLLCARRDNTRQKRLQVIIEKLTAGKKNINEK